VSPYLPLLPSLTDGHAACGALIHPITQKHHFAQLSLERVCLDCASPFNRCGHAYYSLRRAAAPGKNNWCITTHPCTCGSCALYANTGAGDADRRARLEARHDTTQLDAALGVDEPLMFQTTFVENRVPVLLLRRMLLSDRARGVFATMSAMPLVGYHRNKVLPQILCSFERTLGFVRTLAGAELVQNRVIERREELESEYSIDVPEALVSNGRACSIFAAALLRVVVASDLKRAVRTTARYGFTSDAHVQYYEFQLQLFIDTHLDLLLAADLDGAYSDVALCMPLSAKTAMTADAFGNASAGVPEVLRRSAYARAYPHPLRAPMAGQLADMTNAMFDADFFTKTSDNTLSKVSELVHNILSKTGNHRCGGRNFAKMLCEMWGYNSPSLTFVLNILEVHSLGNYPGVVYRPGVRARLAIRRSYSMDEMASEAWCAWCHYATPSICPQPGCDNCNHKKPPKQHKKHICAKCNEFAQIQPKLYAAMREYSVYMVRCEMLIDYIMRVDSEWSAYAGVVALAADQSRLHLQEMYAHRHIAASRDLAAELRAAMRDIELVQHCNKSVQRLRKDYKFAELMCRMCNHAHTQNVVAQTWSGLQAPEDFLEAPLRRNGELYTDERLQRMNACFAPLPHLGNRRWCDVFTLEQLDAVAQVMLHKAGDLVVSMLHLVGVSPDCHRAVCDLYVNSELRNMPDNSFKMACIELYKLFPVDFHIISYLLRRIVHHDLFRTMVLDDRAAVAQVRALRVRHKIVPWDALPPAVSRLYFCSGDFRVYADIIEPLNDALVQLAVDKHDGDAVAVTNAPFGSGPKGALYSHVTHKLHCTRPSSSSIAKKFERDGLMTSSEFFGDSEETATDTDKKTAKSIRVAQNTHRACSAPLKYVDLIGKLVRIGSHVYTRCVQCAGVFMVQNNSITNAGFTCARHLQIGDATCYTHLQEFVTRHTHEIRATSSTASTGAFADGGQIVPLVERFTTLDAKGDEQTHVRVNGQLQILCAPSHVKPKSSPLDKMFCIGTPCFAEDKFKSNVELLSWAAQLGEETMSTRVIARRFGAVAQDELAASSAILSKAAKTLSSTLSTAGSGGKDQIIVNSTVGAGEEEADGMAASEELELLEAEKLQLNARRALFTDEGYADQLAAIEARFAEVREKIAEVSRIADAAAAAVEAAETTENSAGLLLADAERMSNEAIDSGAVLQRVAITCAFCYTRCERHGVFTRVNVLDVDNLFVEPLWQRKITTRGRIDIWLCRTDFARVERFLRSNTLVMASDLWDALVEMKRRMFVRRTAFQHGKK